MHCAADNHNYMCHTCAKEFLDSNFNEQLLTKYQIFTFVTFCKNCFCHNLKTNEVKYIKVYKFRKGILQGI